MQNCTNPHQHGHAGIGRPLHASAACNEPVCQCNKHAMPARASVQDHAACMHLVLTRCPGGWQSFMS